MERDLYRHAREQGCRISHSNSQNLTPPRMERRGGWGSRQLAAAAVVVVRKEAGDCNKSATAGGRGTLVLRDGRGSRRRRPPRQPRRLEGRGKQQPAARSGCRPMRPGESGGRGKLKVTSGSSPGVGGACRGGLRQRTAASGSGGRGRTRGWRQLIDTTGSSRGGVEAGVGGCRQPTASAAGAASSGRQLSQGGGAGSGGGGQQAAAATGSGRRQPRPAAAGCGGRGGGRSGGSPQPAPPVAGS